MPTKFVDNDGNEFTISISFGLIRSIRNEIGIDVSNPNDIPKLLNSQADLISFAWCVLRPKCKQLGISESEFETKLEGENTFNELRGALMRELSDFTRRFGQRALADNLDEAAKLIEQLMNPKA